MAKKAAAAVKVAAKGKAYAGAVYQAAVIAHGFPLKPEQIAQVAAQSAAIADAVDLPGPVVDGGTHEPDPG